MSMSDVLEAVAPASLSEQPAQSRSPSSFDLVPPLGYRNYWYPAAEARRLRKNPIHVKLLGENVVLFRHAETGIAVAMDDRCPHRNASLALGHSYFPGTISCSYHGWTFDANGTLVAVLSEGPSCPLVGKFVQKTYPVREFRGVIWVWIGERDPVPLEEDLPPELVDNSTELFLQIQTWNANWRHVTENTDGYHAPILHFNSMPRTLYMDWVAWRRTTYMETDDGLGLIFAEYDSADRQSYPGLGTWPSPPAWKRIAKKLLGARVARGREIELRNHKIGRITEDVHLPGWRRVRVRKSTVFVEWGVPIDEHTTRHFLWDVILPESDLSPLRRLRRAARVALFRYFIYPSYWRWAYNKRYVGQDQQVLESLYNGPERLQANDSGIVAWRRLSARARGAHASEAQVLEKV
jgi:phenylpropionate dioxygenase-like ring-hydroxylating dioxygenase large terminal subunit